MRRIPLLADGLLLAIVQNFPGEIGFRLRRVYWKRHLKSLGRSVRIDCSVYFQMPGLISIGDNCWIDRGVMLLAGVDSSSRRRNWVGAIAHGARGEVQIGKNVHVGPYSIVSGMVAGVSIGNDCTLSAGVKIYALSHDYIFRDFPGDRSCAFGSMVSPDRQSLIVGRVELGDNVGVATGAVVLPGVKIGSDSFVGIASVVFNADFPENSKIAGQPASRVGTRFRSSELT